MSNATFSASDDARSRLRLVVATIEREMADLSRQKPASEASALTSAWADLVHELDLGPEPERRECPICHNYGMAKATICGFCWTKFKPLR